MMTRGWTQTGNRFSKCFRGQVQFRSHGTKWMTRGVWLGCGICGFNALILK